MPKRSPARAKLAVLFLVCPLLISAAPAMAEPPTDNPVATYYHGDEGYPAWTDRIAWDRVIDMGAKIKTSSGLPDQGIACLIQYYREVVQGLEKWVPKAPKVREQPKSKDSPTSDSEQGSIASLIDESQEESDFGLKAIMLPHIPPND